MTKKHTPPPTRFGQSGAVQNKSASTPRTAATSVPPLTRFGPGNQIQAKALHVTAMVAQHAVPAGRPPAAFVPPTRAIAQLKATQPGWPSGKPNLSVVQKMQREMFEQDFNYAMVPGGTASDQNDFYSDHVCARMKHFTVVIMRVIRFELWAAPQRGGQFTLGQIFSLKAEAQVSSGMYTDDYKLDAAHLMNTTVRANLLKQGLTLTPAQIAAVDNLQLISAATTMQHKANNVGPDKVVDSCMSGFVAAYGAPAVMPKAQDILFEIADRCVGSLGASKKSSNDNYTAAAAGAAEAKTMNTGDIDSDTAMWAEECGFI